MLDENSICFNFSQAIASCAVALICGTEARFCLPDPLTLKVKKIFGNEFRITCATTGNLLFISQCGLLGLSGKQVLKETSGKVVANFKGNLLPFSKNFDIYTGENCDTLICKVKVEVGFIVNAKMNTVFKDAVSGAQKEIILQGSRGGG